MRRGQSDLKGGGTMVDDKKESPRPIPFSGYLDITLSILLPLLGLSFVLLIVFWIAIRPSVPQSAIQSWVIGIITVSLMVGIINAVRYTRKSYKR
jgi:hypothetical protein